MNYWHMQMQLPWGRNKGTIDSKQMLQEEIPVIGVGEWDDLQCLYFKEEDERGLKKGDIVLIREGKKPIALCIVAGPYFQNKKLEEKYHHEYFRNVEILDWYNGNEVFPQPQGTLQRLIDSHTESWKFVDAWYKLAINKKRMKDIIDLLLYKYQIILQGPPGTGKTRLAKEIARELTRPVKVGSPMHKIGQFFKTFDAKLPDVQKKRQEAENLLKEFQENFPREQLKNLQLEQYAIGTGSNDSFCWWIERGLKLLGRYSPGSSKSYLIYWKKDIEDYSKHGKIFKEIEDHEQAMEQLAQTLHELANHKAYEESRELLSPSLILKILHSYYPDEFFPINSEKCLNNALTLCGVDFKELNPMEKNFKMEAFFEKKKKEFKADITNLEFTEFLFNNFDLQGKISLQATEVVSEGKTSIVQFHPAYSYEDFVRGITAEVNDQNQIEYKVTNKTLVEFADRALNNPSAKFVLVIDEINRANLPAVLGELIYALEYRYDENEKGQIMVESMYVLREDKELEGDSLIRLPKNLFIIGTMNTADRSVGHIDYAIRRRFAFVEMLPLQSVVEENACEQAVELFKQTTELFCRNYSGKENKVLERSDFLSPEFRPEDVMIGHSYFLEKEVEKLRLRLQYEIKPILKEYLKDGVLLEEAKAKIEALYV